jgi:flagellar basal-body rod protein FlgB
MSVHGLFGPTITLLERNIHLRAENHSQLAANIANAETPGYTPARLRFEEQLKDALQHGPTATPALTNPRHIPLKGVAQGIESVQGLVVESPTGTAGKDGNSVELEQEMAQMAENQILYTASVQFIGKKFDGLRTAIRGV